MKKVPCPYKGCYQRRPHYTLQDEERGTQMVEVSDDFEGDAYCSLTCMILDGKMSVRNQEEQK